MAFLVKQEEAQQEISKERSARHRQEHRAEFDFTESDEKRWAENRERVLTERNNEKACETGWLYLYI